MFNKILKENLNRAFPKIDTESEEQYIDRLCDWVSKRFVGYSIGTVNGRFKADELKTFSEVIKLLSKGYKYLIDETTAIVKFIFPVGNPKRNEVIYTLEHFEDELEDVNTREEITSEANQIRFLFKNLFVKSILDIVNGEDEIWMLESGIRNKLYIWKKSS